MSKGSFKERSLPQIAVLLLALQRMTPSYLVDASQPGDYFAAVPCQRKAFGRQGDEMSIDAAV